MTQFKNGGYAAYLQELLKNPATVPPVDPMVPLVQALAKLSNVELPKGTGDEQAT